MSTPTETVVETVTRLMTAAPSSTPSGAPPQGGVLEGVMPNEYSPTNPITLFIIQAVIIIVFCRLLHYPLSLLNQPRVIAEVIGGIVLGPSVMMRIPGFEEAIFPKESMPVLNNVANLGLLLFLFLIGLEVDLRMFTRNWQIALCVGLASMILPFALGFAVAWGLYHQFRLADSEAADIGFGVYGLFIGTALAITAFPVLCRILTELNILSSPVGVVVLAAGVGNDVVGWVLLALCVALVNNGSGVTALYVLLLAVAWTLFLVYAVRPPFHWALRKTGSIQNGPTEGMMALTLLLVLTSAFFTSIIGVHAIFGAFVVGLICPHEGGFAIKTTEKIEDLVSALLLPLYFALSGLKTDLGLLNDGLVWAYVIAVISCAFAGKIIGGTLAARAMKLVWRESFAIGCLMSCKGLVELIVLNIGLQANILSQTTFTIFVVMALVTTVSTTPLTKWLYPPWYERKLEKWKRGEIDWDSNPLSGDDTSSTAPTHQIQDAKVRRLLVYLRLDSLPSVFSFISLLGEEVKLREDVENDEARPSPNPGEEAKTAEAAQEQTVVRKRPLEVHALRMLELTERTSSVMKVAEADDYSRRDPVMNAFRTFSQLHDVAVSGNVIVAPEDNYASTLVTEAGDHGSDFVLIPWSEVGSNTEDQSIPFKVSDEDRFSGGTHLDFVQTALSNAVCNTGVFIGNGFSGIGRDDTSRPPMARSITGLSMRSNRETARLPIADKSHHVFFPYMGGADDRVALRFVLQLAKNPNVTATIAHLTWADEEDEITPAVAHNNHPASPTPGKGSGAVVGKEMIHAEITAQDVSFLATLKSSLPTELAGRVTFTEATITRRSAVEQVLNSAREVVGQHPRNSGDMVIVGHNHSRLSAGGAGSELQKVIGTLGAKMTRSNLKASILIIKAAGRGLES